MNRKGVIAPADISISQKLRPLSVGTITYDPAVCNIDGLDFVRVFFPDGSSEVYRVKTVANETGGYCTRALEHGIVWLEDYVCTEKMRFRGTAFELLQKLLSYATGTKWRIGNAFVMEQVDCELNYTNVMQGVMDLLDLIDGYGYEFEQLEDLEWRINLVRLPEESGCEGRLSRNIIDAVVNIDYRDFATRLYVPGKMWHVDSESQALWGIRENVLNVETSGVSDEELREQCEKYFRTNSNPSVSVQVEAHELGLITGQDFDWFSPGKMCRLCLMDYNGAIIEERVTDRTYPNLLTEPEHVVISLANMLPDVSTSINGLAVTMRHFETAFTFKLEDIWIGIEDNASIINDVQIELDAQSARIDLKAEQTVVDGHTQAIKDAFASIDAANAEIALKASQDALDEQGERITTAEQRIDGVNAAIALKANQTEVDEQGERLSQAEVDINAAEAAIALKAEKTSVDSLSERVSQAEVDIDAANAEIALRAKTEALSNVANVLSNRLQQAEIEIAATEAAVLLKANQTDLDGTNERVTQAEIDIDGANAEIALKVGKNDVIAAINLSTEEARIAASRIVLDGYVTASQFAALNASVTNLTTGLTEATALKALSIMGGNIVATESVSAKLLSGDGMNFGGNLVSQREVTMGEIGTVGKALSTGGVLDLQHSHAIVVGEDGVLQLGEVSETGGNFNIADTQYFKDAVSAAFEEGKAAGGGTIVVDDIRLGDATGPVPTQAGLATLASSLGTTSDKLVRCFSSVTVSNSGYYGFSITVKGKTKYYYFIVE